MSTNNENPHLIDTKLSLFHVECHGAGHAVSQVRGVATALAVS